MARYRLKHPCQMDGTVYPAGHVFERPDDWRGPHRSVRTGSESLDINEKSKTVLPEVVDEPLYELVED